MDRSVIRTFLSTFTLLCYLLMAPCLIQAEDWSGFRGPGSQGVSSDEKVPVEWSDEKNLKWKLELPGKGFSSPIVVGKQVLVTCYSGTSASVKRHLVSVDRQTIVPAELRTASVASARREVTQVLVSCSWVLAMPS